MKGGFFIQSRQERKDDIYMKTNEHDYYSNLANWSFDDIDYFTESFTNWVYEEEIRKSYGIQVKDLLCTYEKEQDRKAILLALGIALIIIYYTGFVSILKEVILMSGWLSICSSVYGLIFSSTQSFVKIKRLKNLSKARIYFN